jgi:hypothetical protein
MRRDRRPLQNRVTPFGDVVAISQRGLYIGNRGIIHDPATKTLLGRRWTTKAWLVCVLDYKGRRRELMGGRSWTELFFLDEAVALAAGHRPCCFCRRADAQLIQLTNNDCQIKCKLLQINRRTIRLESGMRRRGSQGRTLPRSIKAAGLSRRNSGTTGEKKSAQCAYQ